MGNILDIGCIDCRYSNEFFLGVGEFFRERNRKSADIVSRIAGIDKYKIIIENSFVQVYRCFSCNCLFNKMEISYKIKDSLPVNYSVLYKCNKCNEPLYPLFSDGIHCSRQIIYKNIKCSNPEINDYELYYYEKILRDIPCYKCGNRKLYLSAWGIFD